VCPPEVQNQQHRQQDNAPAGTPAGKSAAEGQRDETRGQRPKEHEPANLPDAKYGDVVRLETFETDGLQIMLEHLAVGGVNHPGEQASRQHECASPEPAFFVSIRLGPPAYKPGPWRPGSSGRAEISAGQAVHSVCEKDYEGEAKQMQELGGISNGGKVGQGINQTIEGSITPKGEQQGDEAGAKPKPQPLALREVESGILPAERFHRGPKREHNHGDAC